MVKNFPGLGQKPYYTDLKAYIDAQAGTGSQAGESTGNAVAGITLRHPTDPTKQVETWLGTTPDGGPTGYAIAKLNAAGVGSGGGAVDSVNGQTGAVVLDAAAVGALPADTVLPNGDTDLYEPLTFDAFSATSGEWAASTYSDYIAGLDAKLGADLGTTVTKTTIASPNGVPVYAYHTGRQNAPHILIVGGTHGDEAAGAWAAMRFVVAYAQSDHPVMAALRLRCQITFVPWLNPTGYRSARNNFNGVNLNRNYGAFWDYYSSTLQPKGSSAFSEVETAAIKTLLDTTEIACVIDCHVGASADQAICWAVPRGAGVTSRSVAHSAGAIWNETYNLTENVSFGEYGGTTVVDKTPMPTLVDWASRYLPITLGRYNAQAVTIEMDPGELASSMVSTLSQLGATLYAGYIHNFVVTWLTQGQVAPILTPHRWAAHRTTQQPSGVLSAGGPTITTTALPVTWDTYSDGATVALPDVSTFVDVVVRTDGFFVVDLTCVVEAGAAATTSTRIEIALAWGRSPIGNGSLTPMAGHTVGWVDLPTAGSRATYTRTYQLAPPVAATDPSPLARLQVYLSRVAGDADPLLKSASVVVTHQPDYIIDRIASLRRYA